jgi:hypothetical protein
MLSVIMLSVIMLSVMYAECRFAERHYVECRYAECRGAYEKKVMRSLSFFFQLCHTMFSKIIKNNLRLFLKRGLLNYKIGAATLGITTLRMMTFRQTTLSITTRKCDT